MRDFRGAEFSWVINNFRQTHFGIVLTITPKKMFTVPFCAFTNSGLFFKDLVYCRTCKLGMVRMIVGHIKKEWILSLDLAPDESKAKMYKAKRFLEYITAI